MGRLRAVLDTNILIDFLKGIEPARRQLESLSAWTISVITWIEIQVGADNEQDRLDLGSFLTLFEVVALDARVATGAVEARRNYRLRVPDAIIYATAQTLQLPLLTRNTKDFSPDLPGVLIPYQWPPKKGAR